MIIQNNVIGGKGNLPFLFLNVSEIDSEFKDALFLFSTLAKGASMIATPKMLPSSSIVSAVAIIPNLKLYNEEFGGEFSVEEILIQNIGEETYNSIPRITEEDFYTI